MPNPEPADQGHFEPTSCHSGVSDDLEAAAQAEAEAPRLCPECSPITRPVSAGRSAGQTGPGRQTSTAPAARPRHESAAGAQAAGVASNPWQATQLLRPDVGDPGVGDGEIEAG
jgi:hypothetical protein